MPTKPPWLATSKDHFDPVFLTQEDLEDASSFFCISSEDCASRIRSYSMTELADRWRAAGPRSEAEQVAFYENVEEYVWEQLQWHASPDRLAHWAMLERLASLCPPDRYPRVLDFGCGIGTDALYLAARGYRPTLMDVSGPAFRFAQHRFRRRGLEAEFKVSKGTVPVLEPSSFDLALCFDVLEHMPDPFATVRSIVKALRPGGALLERSPFEDDGDHPCHLRSGITRFGSGGWEPALASLGLQGQAGIRFVTSGRRRFVERMRARIWRLTGLWVVRI